MEGFRKKLYSWWRATLSYSTFAGFMLPLMAVSLLVVLLGSKSSYWLSPSHFYPWSSIFPDAAASHNLTAGFRDFTQPAEGGLELRQTVVTGGEKAEALSLDYNPHRSSAPPLSVEVRYAEPPGSSSVPPKAAEIGEAEPPEEQNIPLKQRIEKSFSNLDILEMKLQQSRAAIREAHKHTNTTFDPDLIPTGPVYWSASAFHRSYLEMEKQFKVFVYEQGEHPIFHNGPCGSIYSMEGNFIYKMETSNFRTRDPEKAHVFFLPFSVAAMVHFIFDRKSRDHWGPMKQTVRDYVNLVAGEYQYWNRSLGSDHFMVACHDWGPELSKSLPELFKNSIRALCNANTSEGFKPSKDVTIPEINLRGGRMDGLVGGPSPSKRPILAFFAGGVHGPIRPILLEYWEKKDPDIQVQQYLPKGVSYAAMMRKSRYCICPSGYEVASPRMVEALYTGCVPVIIKDGYVPPFGDVLNWKSFSVEVPVKDIPNLKNILTAISRRQYIRLQRRGMAVRRHFELNLPPKRYDVFHMTLHSIWLRRLNIRLHGVEYS